MSPIQQIAETYLIPLQLLLSMLGMGATLTVSDFRDVLNERCSVILGLDLQYLFVPALGLLFVHAFGMQSNGDARQP